MNVAKGRLFLFVLCIYVIFGGVASYGQQTQASLTGQILDPQGAAIAGSQVVVTNVDTSIARTAQSNDSGRYTVTNLNPGKYSVTVKSNGFSEKVLTNIVLAVGQDGALDVTLSLGSTSDVVTVSASAAVTDTESSSQGTVIDNQKVVGLPLNQRTFYGLALLSPAAYMPGQSSTLGFRGGFNVAGNNETANTFTVNGIDDNDQNVMAPSFRPSVEGIQEFKLLTGVYSAEYGRTSGGQVVVITKTGGNRFHGDVFEFLRNSQFDAKNYFTVPGTPTTFRRNQFGGTIGGPIIKDRTFFFLSYEGLRLAQPVVGQTNVPNPAFVNGDFSSIATQLVNPNKTGAQFSPIGAGVKGNQIIPSGLSPLGLALLKLYPAPDPGQNLAITPNPTYTYNRERIENMDEGSARIDHRFSDKDSMLLQGNYFTDPSFEPSNSLCSSALIPGFGCTTNQTSTLIGANWTHIINSQWLNELRFGYDLLDQPRTGEDVNLPFAKIPGAFNDPTISSAINGGAPQTSVSGYASIHPYGNLPQHRWDNHYNIVDNVSWSKGRHNFKFGVNLLQARYKDIYVAQGTGAFTFSASSANGALTTGNSAVDLALGDATSSTRSPTAPNFHANYNSLGGYVQDDWKVTPTLTLNVGMRYEYFSPVVDSGNIISNYVLPSAGTPSGNILVAGFNGDSRKVYNDDLNNFAPRVGLAYQLFGDDKTVVHASYGIFYNSPSIGNGAILSMQINPPFRLAQTFTSATGAQVQLDSTPFPVVAGTTPDGSAAHPFTSVAPTGIQQNARTLYLSEYGADIQQQISPTMSLTIGYIGNEGIGIPRAFLPNQGVVTGVGSVGGTPTSVSSVRPITAVDGPVGPSGQYYQFGNITYYITSGHSSYNAMTVKAQKNYGNGLSFILAYTWGKSMDNAPGYASSSQASSGTPQNSLNLKAERGLSDFNVGNRIVLSPVYELPFGRNKQFLTHGVTGLVAGGWQLSGIYSYDSGRPFTISSSVNRSGSINGVDRPNLIGNPNNGPKTVAQWFNTAAFAGNAYGQFGSAGRNIIIGPSYSDIDFAIQRNFPLTERLGLQFRAEAFDLANKANFLNPLGTTTGEFIPRSPIAATTTNPNPIEPNIYGNTNASFGKITAANDPRSLQFSAKMTF
jgi:hypothetical protein